MAINIGSNSTGGVYVGSTQINEVYKGGDKVFPDIVYEYELIVQDLQPEAIGGQYQLQITSQKKGIIDGQVVETVPIPYSISGGDSWVSIQDNQLTIQENQSLESRECNVMITQTEIGGKSAEVTITQQAGSYTYSTPSVQLSYDIIQASGGTAHPSISYSQTYGWNGRESGVGTVTSGGSVEYSVGENGNVEVPSKGTEESGVTTVQTVTATVTLNGKQGQAQADIQQAANTASYGEVSLLVQSPIECDVTGGEYRIDPIYSQTISFTSGSTRSGSVSAAYTEQSSMEGFSLSGNIVTVTENQSSTSREGYTVTVTATGEGNKSATDEVIFNQTAGARSYADPVITSFTYPEIPASGGQVTPTVAYEQTWGWNGQTTGGGTITSGAALSFSGTSVNTSTGEVSAASKKTTLSGETTVAEATVKVTLNNKQATSTFQVKQAANTESYGNVTISGGNVAVIPASGGSVSQATGISSSQTVSYTSGASRSGSVSIGYSAAVSATSKGASVSGQTKAGTLTATATGEGGKSASKQFTVYQAANAATSITYGTPSVSLSVSDIPASGGSISSGNVSYSQSRTQNYTSGATSALSALTSGGSVRYSTAVSASSRGTTTGNRRSVGTLTATVAMNGKSGNGSATVYQQANTRSNAGISYGTWSISCSANKTSIPASGGSATISRSASRSRTQMYSYTSGSTSSSSMTNETATPTLSASGSGGSLSGTTLTFPSRGTTVGNARSMTVTASYGGQSKSVTITQAANSATSITYGNITISSFTVSDIPAKGGTISSGSVKYSQPRTQNYSSGSSAALSALTSGGSVSYSAGVSAGNLSTTEKSRTAIGTLTVTVTMNGKSGSKSATVYQQANAVTSTDYSNLTITEATAKDIPASGGSVTSCEIRCTYSYNVHYTSGATKSTQPAIRTTYKFPAAITAPSREKVVGGRKYIKPQSISFTYNGMTAGGSIDIYQEANQETKEVTSFLSLTILPRTVSFRNTAGLQFFTVSGNVTYQSTFTSGATSSGNDAEYPLEEISASLTRQDQYFVVASITGNRVDIVMQQSGINSGATNTVDVRGSLTMHDGTINTKVGNVNISAF